MAPPSGAAIPLPPAERANVPEPPKSNNVVYGPHLPGPNNNNTGNNQGSSSNVESPQEKLKKITEMLAPYVNNVIVEQSEY